MITSIVDYSLNKPEVEMEPECWEMTKVLRKWMLANIYVDSPAKAEEGKARHIIRALFEHYTEVLSQHSQDSEQIERLVTDYISGMTDQYAIEKYKEKFIPKPVITKTSDEAFLKMLYEVDKQQTYKQQTLSFGDL